MSIEAKLAALRDEFALQPDGEHLLMHLIAIGRKSPPLSPQFKTDDRLLPGCISRLWLHSSFRDGCCHFHVDTDAAITKGIGIVVCGLYSAESPHEILAHPFEHIQQLGFYQLLSSNRSNGLTSLHQQIKTHATHCLR